MHAALAVGLFAVFGGSDVCTGNAQRLPGSLKSLDRKGDFKDGVLKVNIPRSDLKMTIAEVATPTPFGFGGWVAFTKDSGGGEVMMGDLVLLQEEVNPRDVGAARQRNRGHRAAQPFFLGRPVRLLHARARHGESGRPVAPRQACA